MEPVPFRRPPKLGSVPAPRRALEVALGAGFTQPTGQVGGQDIDRVVGPGAAFGLSLGYRATPTWSLGVRGEFDASTSRALEATGGNRGGAVVVGPTFHLLPFEIVDPYVSLATGYRVLVEELQGGTHPATSGIDVLRVQVGLDLRSSSRTAFSLFVAGDLTTFAWSSDQSSFAMRAQGARFCGFFSAGAEARFDIGGARARPAVLALR